MQAAILPLQWRHMSVKTSQITGILLMNDILGS